MKLCDLISKIPGAVCPDDLENTEISRISTNFTNVEYGTLYIALTKDKVEKAKDKMIYGTVIMCEKKDAPIGHPCVLCNCIRSAYSFAAAALYGAGVKKLKIIAVTGTNGKTTVTSLISHILNSQNIKTGLIGTVGIFSGGIPVPERQIEGENLGMTTPDPERLFSALNFMVHDKCRVAVIEASSHSLALSKLDALSVNVAVFTNLTEDHLDFHRDVESYFEAKKKIAYISDAILTNAEDKWASKMVDEFGAYSICRTAAVGGAFAYAADIKHNGLSGTVFKAFIGQNAYNVKTPMFADYSVFNILAALGAVSFVDADISLACKAVASFGGVKGRCEIVNGGLLPVAVIDYAHTPDAMVKTLKSLRSVMKDGRLIVVFGCGGERERGKRPLMGKAACEYADFSVLTEDNSRSENTLDIISEIEKGFERGNYTVEPSRRSAIEKAVFAACDNDVIAVLGKGHEKYITDSNGKRRFDDREETERALIRRKNIIK